MSAFDFAKYEMLQNLSQFLLVPATLVMLQRIAFGHVEYWKSTERFGLVVKRQNNELAFNSLILQLTNPDIVVLFLLQSLCMS